MLTHAVSAPDKAVVLAKATSVRRRSCVLAMLPWLV